MGINKKSNKHYKGAEKSSKTIEQTKFIKDIYDRCEIYNSGDEEGRKKRKELRDQKEALKYIVKYIKYRKSKGATLEEVETEIKEYLGRLMNAIQSPDLMSFYRLRTLEYICKIDITPYLEELIRDGVDMIKFSAENINALSADIEKNIKVELAGILSDLLTCDEYVISEELKILRNKIEKNEFEMSDITVLKKFVEMFCKENEMNKVALWKKIQKNPEIIRKKMYDNLSMFFDIDETALTQNTNAKENDRIISSIQNCADIDQVIQKIPKSNESINVISSCNLMDEFKQKRVIYNPKIKNPFISNEKKYENNNYLIYVKEIFDGFFENMTEEKKAKFANDLYRVIVLSETAPINERMQYCELIYECIDNLRYTKNTLHVRDYLSERITILVDFFFATESAQSYCKKSNERFTEMNLEQMVISPEDYRKKFIPDDKDINDLYFLKEQNVSLNYYEDLYKDTALYNATDEAIIGMSGFYVNRLAKVAPGYARLKYILDQKDAIRRIYENPDIEFHELGYSENDIIFYMSMYDEIQLRALRMYYKKIEDGTYLYDEKESADLLKIFEEIRYTYNNLHKFYGVNVDRMDLKMDLPNIVADIQIIQELYKLKEFAIKSLIYTVKTDRKKGIINWGCVRDDKNKDPNMELIAFDIGLLNMPLFFHVRRDALKDFMKELTGEMKIPVYEGENDMYSYKLQKRLSTLISYPTSKAERKKIMEIDKEAGDSLLHMHLRWLCKPSARPKSISREPGSRMYNLETCQVESTKKKMPSDR